MKAIIIEEERFTEICNLMKARAETAKYPGVRPDFLDERQWQIALKAAHRAINFEFVRWAQSHGASCVK